jgi:glycosyltransferase involved in cell wall biosynthesis|tara:strand:+ start:2064 stop:3026 length:963 start_codon:yes stop_codon:yes gene_type:complete
MTLVSVIIPTRNRGDLVKGAVENVLKQTYTDIEIIVVEDGSKSGIKDYLKELNDSRVHYYAHNKRKGLSASRNSGTRIANGKYIAFMDDDERWLNNKIDLQCNLIECYDDENVMIYCGNIKIDQNGLSKEIIPSAKGEMIKYFFNGHCIGSSCMMISRKNLLSIGGHSENITSCIDHDLWLKLSQFGFIMDYVPRGMVYSVKHNNPRMMENIDERLKGIKKFFNKWKNIVKKELGLESWNRIENLYHVQTAQMLFDRFEKGYISRKLFYKAIKFLLQIQEEKYNWFDVWLLINGKNHLTPIKKSKNNLAKRIIKYIKIID